MDGALVNLFVLCNGCKEEGGDESAIDDDDNHWGEEEKEPKKKEEEEDENYEICRRWGRDGVMMDNNNVDNTGDCFLENARYVIDDIDDDIDDFDNEVDALINIIGGWIGAGPFSANKMWVLEISSGLEQ